MGAQSIQLQEKKKKIGYLGGRKVSHKTLFGHYRIELLFAKSALVAERFGRMRLLVDEALLEGPQFLRAEAALEIEVRWMDRLVHQQGVPGKESAVAVVALNHGLAMLSHLVLL